MEKTGEMGNDRVGRMPARAPGICGAVPARYGGPALDPEAHRRGPVVAVLAANLRAVLVVSRWIGVAGTTPRPLIRRGVETAEAHPRRPPGAGVAARYGHRRGGKNRRGGHPLASPTGRIVGRGRLEAPKVEGK